MQDNIRVVVALLRRDIKIMMQFLVDNIIDSMILVSFIYLMYGKLLPLMGISTAMVTPAFVGIFVIAMINVAYDRALKDALDFENTRFIDYQIILPLSMRWLLIKYIISYVIDLFLASFPVLIMGSLLFGTLLDISNANFPLFFLLYLLSMIIVGSLLFCVVVAKPFQWVIENMWPRILLPLVALGALYYPWRPVSELMPITSKLMLLLPTVSIVEGLRSALTGNPLYLSAYWCGLGMLVFIVGIVSLVFWYMQKRIDPV